MESLNSSSFLYFPQVHILYTSGIGHIGRAIYQYIANMSKLEAGRTNSHATLCTSFLPFCNKHSHPHTHTYRHLTPVPFALVLSAELPISHTQICPKIYDRLLNLYFESYMQCHRGTCRTKGAKI